MPVEGLVGLRTAQAPGKSRDGPRRNALFRRTHIHLEAGRAASDDSEPGPPTPSVALPRSRPDLFSQRSSLLLLPPCPSADADCPLYATFREDYSPSWWALRQEAQWVYPLGAP